MKHLARLKLLFGFAIFLALTLLVAGATHHLLTPGGLIDRNLLPYRTGGLL